jgi:TetR/AcrR family transcriptional regulator, transcriptional repressor for nem operon
VTPHGLRTREALLDAGRELAQEHGLSALSVNAVIERAGVAKGTFYVHFADRNAYVEALNQAFFEGATAAVAKAVKDLPPGSERLLVGLNAYLDACLAQKEVKGLLREAQRQGGVLARGSARHEALVTAVAPNLKAMGWPEARVAAGLVIAATSEVALLELEQGRKDALARRALRRLIRRADLTAGEDR